MKAIYGLGLAVLLTCPLMAQIGDVSGIRLGMTFDQAKSQLGPEFHANILKSPDPAYQEMTLTLDKAGNKDGYILDALQGKIFQIVRTSATPPNKPLGEAAMKEQVEKKYGTPTYDNSQGNGILAWMYDAQGKIMGPTGFGSAHEPNVFFDKCHIEGGRQSPPLDIGIGTLLPTQYRGDCGVVLEISGMGGRSDHVIEAFAVHFVDNHTMYLHLHAAQEQAAEKARKERDASQKRTTPM